MSIYKLNVLLTVFLKYNRFFLCFEMKRHSEHLEIVCSRPISIVCKLMYAMRGEIAVVHVCVIDPVGGSI